MAQSMLVRLLIGRLAGQVREVREDAATAGLASGEMIEATERERILYDRDTHGVPYPEKFDPTVPVSAPWTGDDSASAENAEPDDLKTAPPARRRRKPRG